MEGEEDWRVRWQGQLESEMTRKIRGWDGGENCRVRWQGRLEGEKARKSRG